MNLAPIAIFTFNRLEHTQKTIEALLKNKFVDNSDIYIFSDGPRNKEEKEKVDEVRKYLRSISSFKNINIIESEKNLGLANSIIKGVSEIIGKHDKIIVLEDDLVVAPYFLEYMNEALNKYELRDDIWSISGYSPNINIPNSYRDDVFLIRRGSSWGWATWKDRWELNDWDIRDYKNFIKNREKKYDFNSAGNDLTPMLNDQIEKRINSWAIRWVYNQYKEDKWTVYPVKSLVKNIGNDLSGTHSSVTDKFDVNLSENKIVINLEVKKDNDICKNFKKFYDLKLSGYLAIGIKKVGLYKQARKIRNIMLKSLKSR